MLTRDESPEQLRACAACGAAPANAGFWGSHLCDTCIAAWFVEGGSMWEGELAHANAHPEDVEYRGVKQFPCAESPNNEIVILKPGVTERITRDVALAWLEQRKKTQQRRSA